MVIRWARRPLTGLHWSDLAEQSLWQVGLCCGCSAGRLLW
jgi:hypothetical protein